MNRMYELQRNAKKIEDDVDIEESKHPAQEETENLHSSFLIEIDRMRDELHHFTTIVEELKTISQSVIQSAIPQREDYYSRLFADHISTGNQVARSIKDKVYELQSQTQQLRQRTSSTSAEIRMRENLTGTVINRYALIMKEYQSLQTHSRMALRKKITRQILLINPEIQENIIEKALDESQYSQNYIKDAILKNKDPAESIQNAYLVAQSKYDDMKLLESSISQLNQLFLDLASITTTQGELLDQIEYNVTQSKEYIEEGNVDLEKATSFMISIQKKRICIALIVLAIVGLIIGLVTARATGKI
eukprot:gene3105-3303_t